MNHQNKFKKKIVFDNDRKYRKKQKNYINNNGTDIDSIFIKSNFSSCIKKIFKKK